MVLRAVQERRQEQHLPPPNKAAAEVLDGTGGHKPLTLRPPAIMARSQAGAGQTKTADCIEPVEPGATRRIIIPAPFVPAVLGICETWVGCSAQSSSCFVLLWSRGRPVLVQFLLELRHDLRMATPTAKPNKHHALSGRIIPLFAMTSPAGKNDLMQRSGR
eukprot:COSAG02_NODE_548_length_20472_cov_5.958524_5_plen_161_part_00